jgi:hypothetical protein
MGTPGDSNSMAELFRRLAMLNQSAFGEIATRAWDMLRSIARRRLAREPELTGIYDEEDAIQSSLTIYWLGLLSGKLPPPDGMDGFLRMARTIIARRIRATARAQGAQKRNPTPNAEEMWSIGTLYWLVPDDVDLLAFSLPSAEAEAIAADQTRWLLSLLGWELREVAEDRFLYRRTVDEIAAIRRKSRRKIERMLSDIRTIWYDAHRNRDA